MFVFRAATIALGFFFTLAAQAGDLDRQLLDEVSYHYLNPLDSAKIKDLVQRGANANVTDEIGFTPLQWIVIQASNIGLDPSLLDLADFLLEHGADPNIADLGNNRTPLANEIAFVPDPLAKLRDLLIMHGAHFTSRNAFGADLLLEALRNGKFEDATLFLQRGTDPMTRDIYGNTALMYYVRAALTPISLHGARGADFLSVFFDSLSSEEMKVILNAPNEAGTTPLIEASRFDNIALVKELLRRGADPSRADQEGQTPLSIAQREGYSELAAILQAQTHKLVPLSGSDDIQCQKANSLPIDFEKLVAIISKCAIKSIDDLLPLLPQGLRSSYTLVYDSRSLQGASPDNPRVILFGKDGKLILTINGDPSQDRYYYIEAIQFRDANKQFEFRDIQFDSANPPKAAPIVSDRNPSLCLDCHRYGRLRPNWDQFSLWPGVFGSENGYVHSKEKTFYDRYLARRHQGRYQYLLEPTDELPRVRGILQQDESSGAVRFGDLLDELNFQSIARELRDDRNLQPYRYALLAALSCDEGDGGIQGYIPASAQSSWSTKYPGLEKRMADWEIDGYAKKSARQSALIPGAPEDFRQRETLEGFRSVLDERQKAQLYYLVQASTAIRAMYWSMELESQHFSFSLNAGGFTVLEYDLWRELLDPVQDANLYQNYSARVAEANARGDFSIFYRRPEARSLCVALKQKSLAQFRQP